MSIWLWMAGLGLLSQPTVSAAARWEHVELVSVCWFPILSVSAVCLGRGIAALGADRDVRVRARREVPHAKEQELQGSQHGGLRMRCGFLARLQVRCCCSSHLIAAPWRRLLTRLPCCCCSAPGMCSLATRRGAAFSGNGRTRRRSREQSR
jgi:hypothetical protein